MADSNVTLVGRLTHDPELKFLNSGAASVRVNIAVEKRWQNRQTQEWETRVSFFTLIVWNKMAENVAASLKKGYRVVVFGALEQRSWETDTGEKRSVVEVVVEAIGPDLRFVTAELHGGEHAAPASAPGTDEDPF